MGDGSDSFGMIYILKEAYDQQGFGWTQEVHHVTES